MKARFGTLSDYFDAIWKKTGVKAGTQPPDYPTLSGDFYTYADRFVKIIILINIKQLGIINLSNGS